MMHQPEKTIGIKLAMISASLIIAILSVGVVGINALDALNKSMNSIVDVAATKVQLGEKFSKIYRR
ncbi:MAG: hypothetical protein ACJAYC_000820 [Halieaceae bacterium]|jgi:hypothetical protein